MKEKLFEFIIITGLILINICLTNILYDLNLILKELNTPVNIITEKLIKIETLKKKIDENSLNIKENLPGKLTKIYFYRWISLILFSINVLKNEHPVLGYKTSCIIFKLTSLFDIPFKPITANYNVNISNQYSRYVVLNNQNVRESHAFVDF